MTRPQRLWLALVLLSALTLACAESALTPAAPGRPTVPPITSSALQPTLEQAQIEIYLNEIQAQEAERVAQQTLQAVYAQHTATAQAAYATSTAQAWEAAATAQAQAQQAAATAWQTTVEAGFRCATATAQAAAWQATATAQAAQVTATADSARFNLELQATAQALAATASADSAQAALVATLHAEQLQQAHLDTEAAERALIFRAYGPWLALAVASALALWLILRLYRVEERRRSIIPRDARGDAPLVMVALPGGGIAYYDPDRAFTPVLTVDAQGQVAQPAAADPLLQAQVTERDQLLDLAHRGLPSQARATGAPAAARPAPPVYRILSPESRPPQTYIDAQALPALDADWKKEVSHE